METLDLIGNVISIKMEKKTLVMSKFPVFLIPIPVFPVYNHLCYFTTFFLGFIGIGECCFLSN